MDLEWGQIHLRTAHPVNSSDATPVVCFAPTPYSGNYYKLLMKELARDRVVIAPDYPGLGQSDRPDTDLEVADHADIMAEVLIAAGWGPTARGPVDACGYHTGTFIATELALRHPALIRRLVLIGVPFYQGAERAERYERLEGSDHYPNLSPHWSRIGASLSRSEPKVSLWREASRTSLSEPPLGKTNLDYTARSSNIRQDNARRY